MNHGFLIYVGGKKPIKPPPTFKKNNISLFVFDEENKNIKYNLESDRFSIYIGDKHFQTSSTDKHLTGLKINFQQKKITIESDFLGSERVYYQHSANRIVISNRIDNLSESNNPDIDSIYSFLSGGFTVGSNTVLNDTYQTRQLETIIFNTDTLRFEVSYDKRWKKKQEHSNFYCIGKKFREILKTSPDSNLMLSGGWDSRLLLSDNPDRIRSFYTHGDIASREIDITKKLAKNFIKPIALNPLQESDFSVEKINEMLKNLGHCLFPHWYYASEHLYKLNELNITSGLGVEHISGHYGLNSLLDGKQKVKALYNLLFSPDRYEKITNTEASKILKNKLSSAFTTTPWFFGNKFDVRTLNNNLIASVNEVIENYIDQGTHGINELSERFKMEHVNRQFFVLQTKTSCNRQGYYHPYVDSELAELVIQIPYYKRVNYKLSQALVEQSSPELLNLPMAAMLVSARKPIYQQEISRIIRILIEKQYQSKTGKVKKGLGWNNFQFLNKSNIFHDYVDNLKNNELWNKEKMHNFIKDFRDKEKNAYSLLEMMTKISTVDYQIK